MTSRLLAVSYAAQDPPRLARFWAGLLGRDVVSDGAGVLLPGSATQVGLRFAPSAVPRTGPGRLHLHVTSEGSDQESVVSRALGLGAGHLDVGQRPEEAHVVLADPEGNELCVIESGSSFLAGCGVLGEVACEGGRAVGQFWAAALGWPLVWDQDGETAVQAPLGGTKLAWGGPPVPPVVEPARQWFELVPDRDLDPDADPDAEVERLVALGATRVAGGDGREGGAGPGVVVLADPDGQQVRVRTR